MEVRAGFLGCVQKGALAGVVELDLGCLSPKGWKRNGGRCCTSLVFCSVSETHTRKSFSFLLTSYEQHSVTRRQDPSSLIAWKRKGINLQI